MCVNSCGDTRAVKGYMCMHIHMYVYISTNPYVCMYVRRHRRGVEKRMEEGGGFFFRGPFFLPALTKERRVYAVMHAGVGSWVLFCLFCLSFSLLP